jgi:transcriptional regulator with XRE-family HTH domain
MPEPPKRARPGRKPKALSPATEAERIGALLRSAREMAGLSQTALAGALGISHDKIQKWERGASIPAERLRELARALGCRPGDLLE